MIDWFWLVGWLVLLIDFIDWLIDWFCDWLIKEINGEQVTAKHAGARKWRGDIFWKESKETTLQQVQDCQQTHWHWQVDQEHERLHHRAVPSWQGVGLLSGLKLAPALRLEGSIFVEISFWGDQVIFGVDRL